MKKAVIVLLLGLALLFSGCGRKAEPPLETPGAMGKVSAEPVEKTEEMQAEESSRTTGDPLTAGELETYIVDFYMARFNPEGEYVIFDTENTATEESLSFIVRYRPSDKEEEEMIAAGRGPIANIYVTTVRYNKMTDTLTDENGLDLKEGRTD